MKTINFPKWQINTFHQQRWVMIGGVIAMLISIFLIRQSLSVRFTQYQQYRDNLIQLQTLDAEFEQEILKSRYQLYASYDRLVQNLTEQKSLQQQLQIIPRFVNLSERKEIQQMLKEREKLLEKKVELSEEFKSRNALLKNSLRYLPLLTQQLTQKLEAKVQSNTWDFNQTSILKNTLNDLIQNLLLYNIAVDEQLASNIINLTEKLSQLELQYELTADEFPSQIVRAHTNIILTTKPQVEQLTTQLIQASEQQSNGLEQRLAQTYQQAIRTTTIYRLTTYVWFVFLLISINYLVLQKIRQQPVNTMIDKG